MKHLPNVASFHVASSSGALFGYSGSVREGETTYEIKRQLSVLI